MCVCSVSACLHFIAVASLLLCCPINDDQIDILYTVCVCVYFARMSGKFRSSLEFILLIVVTDVISTDRFSDHLLTAARYSIIICVYSFE